MKSEKGFKETDIGMVPNSWEIKKIDDICELIKISYDPIETDQIPYLGLEHIKKNSLRLNGIGKSSDTKSRKFVFQHGQILFGKLRPYFRKVYRPNFDGVCSTDIFVIDGKESYDNSFLFYFFANPHIIALATLSSEGTRMPRVSWNYLKGLIFPIPPYSEQVKIANFLTTLDRKIELNYVMNQTLKDIIEVIFKQWFVNFNFPDDKDHPYNSSGGMMVDSKIGPIPKGWEVVPLDEKINFLNGLALQKYPSDSEDDLPVIKIRELKQGITEATDRSSKKIPPEYIIDNGDIIFSWSGTLELVIWGEGKGALNQHLFKVTSKKYPKWFYYQQIKTYLPSFRQIAADKTTTMGHIKRHHISDVLIPIPPEEIFNRASNILNPLFERLISNKVESQNLAELRDKLLPKLMNGNIRVGLKSDEDAK